MSLLRFTPIIRLLREICCYNLELKFERQLDRARTTDLVQRIDATVGADSGSEALGHAEVEIGSSYDAGFTA